MKKVFFLIFLIGSLCWPDLALSQAKSINCNGTPDVPDPSWTVESSQPDGTYMFDPAAIKLISFESRTTATKGQKMLDKVKDTGLNACVADYLLSHPDLIPETWKTKHVVFPGTIFKDAAGNRCLKFIYFWEGEWHGKFLYLEESYDDKSVAMK